MLNRAARVLFLVLGGVLLGQAAEDDACPNCPFDWEPVCGQGKNVAENTHANACFANCSCSLFDLASPCILRQGECNTAPIQSDGCPPLPLNIAPSHARREQLADASTWDFIIDVRRMEEFEGLGANGEANNEIGRIPGTILAENLATDDATLPHFPCKTARILVVCRTGRRSLAVVQKLQAQGFSCVFNLDGGTLSWKTLGYPIESGAIASGSDRILQNSASLWEDACRADDSDDDAEEESDDDSEDTAAYSASVAVYQGVPGALTDCTATGGATSSSAHADVEVGVCQPHASYSFRVTKCDPASSSPHVELQYWRAPTADCATTPDVTMSGDDGACLGQGTEMVMVRCLETGPGTGTPSGESAGSALGASLGVMLVTVCVALAAGGRFGVW